MPMSGGRVFQKEGMARTKTRRGERGWLIRATERRPAGGSTVSGGRGKGRGCVRGLGGHLTWGPILPSLGKRKEPGSPVGRPWLSSTREAIWPQSSQVGMGRNAQTLMYSDSKANMIF